MRNHNQNDRKIQQYNLRVKVHDSNTVTLVRCAPTELLRCYFVQPTSSTNQPSRIGSDDRHRPTSRLPSSFRLRERCTSTSGTPADRGTRAFDACAAASHDSCTISVETRAASFRRHLSSVDTLGCWCPTSRWNAEFQVSHMLLSCPPQWRWRRGRSTRLGRTWAAVVGSGPVVGRGGVGGWRLNDAVSSSDISCVEIVNDVVEVLGVLARRCAIPASTSASGKSARPSSIRTKCLATSSALYRAVSPRSWTCLHVLWQRWKKQPCTRTCCPNTAVTACIAAISKSVTTVVGSALKPSAGDGLQHLGVDSLGLARQQGVDARNARRAERSTNDVQLMKHGWRQRKVAIHVPRVRPTQHTQTIVCGEHDDAVASVRSAVMPQERLRVVATSRQGFSQDSETARPKWPFLTILPVFFLSLPL